MINDKKKNKNNHDDIKEWKDVIEKELDIKDQIVTKLLKRDGQLKEEIKKLKEVIQIPRSHFKNLEK